MTHEPDNWERPAVICAVIIGAILGPLGVFFYVNKTGGLVSALAVAAAVVAESIIGFALVWLTCMPCAVYLAMIQTYMRKRRDPSQ